jgi:hypothetical protein
VTDLYSENCKSLKKENVWYKTIQT